MVRPIFILLLSAFCCIAQNQNVSFSFADPAFMGAIQPVATSSGPTNLTDGLVGWWKFDEGTGTSTTADASGNSLDATLINSPAWVTGKIGLYSLELASASSQTIRLPASTILKPTNFTFCTWVNVSAAGRVYVGYGADFSISLQGGSPYTLSANFYQGSTVYIEAVVPQNVWTHIACTYDGTNAKLWTNGVVCKSQDTGLTWEGGTGVTYIGSDGSGNYLSGSIDDFRVYDKVVDLDYLYHQWYGQ